MEESSSHSEVQTGTRSSTNLKGKKNTRTNQCLDRYKLMIPLPHSLLRPFRLYHVTQHVWLPQLLAYACSGAQGWLAHVTCTTNAATGALGVPQQSPPSSLAATDELHSIVPACSHLGKLFSIICVSGEQSKAGNKAGGREKWEELNTFS